MEIKVSLSQLKKEVKTRHSYMAFLVDEVKHDTSKIDILQQPSYDYYTLIEDIVSHYQSIIDLQAHIDEIK